MAQHYVQVEFLLYPHQHFSPSLDTLNPPQFVWKPKDISITHFQSVDQYYTIFKIKRGHFNNRLPSLQNFWANRTLLVLIENS